MNAIIKKFNKLITKNKVIITMIIGGFILLLLGWFAGSISKTNKVRIEPIEYVDTNKVYHKIQEDNTLKDLKKENKELYDSLKKYKNEIEFLAQFRYTKTYDTGKIITKEDTLQVQDKEINEYEYSSEDNDTLNYNLTIASTEEPNWYRLQMKVSDKFTVINKRVADNMTETTIQSDYKGDISDVTVVRKKEKTKLRNRIAIGPSITYGYSTSSHKLEPTIGIGVTFNLFAK